MAKIVQGYEFPDDATQEEIQKALSSVRPARRQEETMPAAPQEMSWGEYGKGLARSAASGLTFNWSDEGIAAIRSRVEGIPYEQALADERAKKKAFEEQYPVPAIAAEIAGGVPTLFVPGLGAAKVAQSTMQAGRLGRAVAGPVAQATKAGAIQGTLAGTGESESTDVFSAEDIAQRLKGAGAGAAVGAGVGATVGTAVKAGTPIVRGVMERFRPEAMAEDVAKMKVLQDLQRSGMTPAQAQREFEYLQSTGASPSYFDVSGPLTSRAESVVQREGAAGEGIVEDIVGKQRAQRERIMGQAKERLGQTKNYYETAEDAATALRTQAKPFYEKAYKAEIPVEAQYELQSIMNKLKNASPKAIQYAKELFSFERESGDFKRLGTRELPSGNEAFDMIPNVQQWDYIMRGLGQVISKETDSVTREITPIGGAATKMRAQIANILDKEVPEFGAARRQYKGDLEVKQALDEARKGFNRVDPEELAISWGGMSVAEKEAYRAGALKNIRDSLFGSRDYTDATSRIGQAIQDRRDALNIIMPEKASARLFQDYLEAEAKIAANAQKIKAGSPTERRKRLGKDLEVETDLSMLGVARQAAQGSYFPAMNTLFSILAKNPAIPEKRVEAIGEMLRKNDMKGVERLTKSLEAFVEEQARKQAKAAQVTKTVAGRAGRVSGGEAAEGPGEPIPELTIPVR